MSLLTIIQRAARSMSLAVPTAVVNSSDPQVQQMWELANEAGEELARDFDWQILRREQTFLTVADAEQANWFPSDFDRFLSDTQFNRSTRRNLIGPITPQQWQAIQAQPQLNRVFLAWIERGGEVLVTPEPAAGETIAYEYISENWCQSSLGAGQTAFLADADTALIDERLIRLSLRWRFLAAKGLSYAEEMRTFGIELEKAKARDGGNTVINSTGSGPGGYVPSNYPEGDFPGP